MVFSNDGQYLITLSVPRVNAVASEETKEGQEEVDDVGAPVQELCMWDCRSVLAALDGSAGSTDDEGGAPAPKLVASAVIPIAEEQTSIVINPHALALPVGELRDPVGLGHHGSGGLLTGGFELSTTGAHTVVFWVATCTAVKDEEAGARLRKMAQGGSGSKPGSPTTVAALAAAARNATKDEWALFCDAPIVPKIPSNGIDKATGKQMPPEKRVLKCSAFVSGAMASAMATVDDAVQTLAATGQLQMQGSQATSAAAQKAAGRDGKNRELLIEPTGASVCAVTGTSDGSLLLWRLSHPTLRHHGNGAANNHGYSSIAEAASRLARKECLKHVKLTLPDTLNIAKGTETDQKKGDKDASAANLLPSNALNVIIPAPSGRHIVVGTGDGAVRVYDLHMRLVGWFEDMQAGPVTALSFIPGTGIASSGAGGNALNSSFGGFNSSVVSATAAPTTDATATLTVVPDLTVATGRSMVLSLRMSAFDQGDEEGMRGTVLLEGPDARVTGLAAYPNGHTVAVAVASGCVQVWDYLQKTLLLVRELARPADALADHLQRAEHHAPYYTPSAIATDPRGRYLAVGTVEGAIFILNPHDLSDAQPPIQPPHWPRSTPNASITKMAFSPDGYHLAAADEGRHVALYRFIRTSEKRLMHGAENTTASARLHSRKPWESVTDDKDRFEEVTVDSWAYIGRIQSHSQAVTGLAFSPLPDNSGAGSAHPSGEVPGLEGPAFWPIGTVVGDRNVAAQHAASGLCMLASVGADRRLCVYDVGSSSATGGLQLRGARCKIEQFGVPMSCVFEPTGVEGTNSEEYGDYDATQRDGGKLTVATDAFKFKQWDCGASPSCTRTVLAPTFGGSVTHLAYLASSAASSSSSSVPASSRGYRAGSGAAAAREAKHNDQQHKRRPFYAMAYATDDRVVGVVGLPLSGNPYAVTGVVGHTGPVTGLAASFDGSHLFTAGQDSGSGPASSSGSVCIWAVSERAVEQSVAAGGTGMAPFLSLLEGGASGSRYQEICDIFAYGQVHAQGEASTQPRRAGITLPITELASVMRALGFFPTTEELAALTNEARLSSATAANASNESAVDGGAGGGSVDLPTLVRLYVNHRPVVQPSQQEVINALNTVMAHASAQGETDDAGAIRWGGLTHILNSYGEALAAGEADSCLQSLVGNEQQQLQAGGGAVVGLQHDGVEPLIDDDELISGDDLATRILGLQAFA